MRKDVIEEVAATREPARVKNVGPRQFLFAKSRNVHRTTICAEVQNLLPQLESPNKVAGELSQFRGSLVD
jgi:hypothetical protein